MDTIGVRVREIRNRYGMSQESFAESLNTYRIRINRIENNQIYYDQSDKPFLH